MELFDWAFLAVVVPGALFALAGLTKGRRIGGLG